MMAQPSVTILLVDDEGGFASALATLLRRDGHKVDTAENGQRALRQMETQQYDLILCDLRLPELSGNTLYDVLWQQYPHLCHRVIFLTGDTLNAESLAFLEACGQPWLPKPCSAAQVREVVQQLLAKTDGHPRPGPDALQAS